MRKEFVQIATIALFLGSICSAQQNNQAAKKGSILIVLSSQNQLQLKNGAVYPTGFYLNELAVPAKALSDAGYTLVFADPQGNAPTMDVRSDNVKYFGNDATRYAEIKTYYQSLTALQAPQKLVDIKKDLTPFVGIFIPGGHAPMVDLMADSDLGQILTDFHNNNKPTALICHGPIALASTTTDPVAYQKALSTGDWVTAQTLTNGWPYKGYKMTVFSTTEELLGQKNIGGQTLFYPETGLQLAGGTLDVAPQWTSHVVQDRELITGQNPFSDQELANALLKSLATGEAKN